MSRFKRHENIGLKGPAKRGFAPGLKRGPVRTNIYQGGNKPFSGDKVGKIKSKVNGVTHRIADHGVRAAANKAITSRVYGIFSRLFFR